MAFFFLHSQKPTGYIFRLQASAADRSPTEPRSSLVDLEIKVIESDKQTPTFVGELPGPVIELYENFTSVTDNIAVLKAMSVNYVDLSTRVSINSHNYVFVFFIIIKLLILVFKYSSNTVETAPLFQLVSGKNEETNSKDTFVLKTNAKKDTAFIRYGGSVALDYETLKEYTLTVRIEVVIANCSENFEP